MVVKTGQALLDEMLASKQAAISRRAAAGAPVPADISAGAENIMVGGQPVWGAGITRGERIGEAALGMIGAAQMNGTRPEIAQSGIPGLLGGIPAALGALGVTAPGWLMGLLGAGGAAYAGYQALGGGEGEGLFGLDILGGGNGNGTGKTWISGIPLGGPGLAEPPAAWVIKEWHVEYKGLGFRLQYYLVEKPNGRRYIMMYHTGKEEWKAWPWRKPSLAVIGKNMPKHKMIVRLRRNLGKQTSDARTILKLTSPASLRQPKRRRYGGRHRH